MVYGWTTWSGADLFAREQHMDTQVMLPCVPKRRQTWSALELRSPDVLLLLIDEHCTALRGLPAVLDLLLVNAEQLTCTDF